MPSLTWVLLLLLAGAALMFAALWYGGYVRPRVQNPWPEQPLQPASEPAPVAPLRRETPRPTAAPPPVLAGDRRVVADAGVEPVRRSAPPPASPSGPVPAVPERRATPPPAAAGNSSPQSASPTPQHPKRTSTPPPAQAAWSSDDPAKGPRKS